MRTATGYKHTQLEVLHLLHRLPPMWDVGSMIVMLTLLLHLPPPLPQMVPRLLFSLVSLLLLLVSLWTGAYALDTTLTGTYVST